ncbi:heme o synthase [Bacillus alkalicellulosilyticus]|uniref:heme o synthase n=1 Tax=Alkalihalobacterium alkalicellulosilyticum TaxID=1912214 RepID=UPI0009963251|nr:heme o synthase [Bacillus alkalicellulosilyticus]
MNKHEFLLEETISKKQRGTTLLTDVCSLLKAPVLIANVLPVVTGFSLALYFSGSSIYDYWGLFLLAVIGSTSVMAGALILNNWYDVDIDAIMARTKQRPTVTGNIPLQYSLVMGVFLTILGFIVLSFTTFEAVLYAFIGWFTYVVLYTMWSKRRYTSNTAIGSISGAVTPVIGWSVINPEFHIVPLILSLILFVWQMPHTFAIAIRKYDEYKAAGVAMLPVVKGVPITKKQIVVYVACLVPLPFFLSEIGVTFIVISSLLNVTWLAISIIGMYTKDNQQYSYVSFLYSVFYITFLFVLMILVSFF